MDGSNTAAVISEVSDEFLGRLFLYLCTVVLGCSWHSSSSVFSFSWYNLPHSATFNTHGASDQPNTELIFIGASPPLLGQYISEVPFWRSFCGTYRRNKGRILNPEVNRCHAGCGLLTTQHVSTGVIIWGRLARNGLLARLQPFPHHLDGKCSPFYFSPTREQPSLFGKWWGLGPNNGLLCTSAYQPRGKFTTLKLLVRYHPLFNHLRQAQE